MSHTPSSLRRGLLAAFALAATGAPAWSQSGSPVRILVGFPPGGGTDAIARALADKLKDVLGVPVIVENKAGAGGQIAAQALKAAAPDGTTFFLSHDHSISILPLVTRNAGFDPATDFVAVAGFASFANVLAVSGGTPAKTLQEYIAWVQSARGGKDTIGVPAPGSIPEFLVGLIGARYKVDLQAAPYRGSAPLIGDMLGNQISAGVASVPDFIEQQKAGKLRIVAVIGDKRQALVPDAPTFAELGFSNLDDLPYYGLFAPAGTPPAAVERFGQALQRVIAMPDVRERLAGMGLTVGYQPPAQFAGVVRKYTQTWERIIKASGFQPK
jgi:tripartite-type tricarboxylate transporter receptor subunit TctC